MPIYVDQISPIASVRVPRELFGHLGQDDDSEPDPFSIPDDTAGDTSGSGFDWSFLTDTTQISIDPAILLGGAGILAVALLLRSTGRAAKRTVRRHRSRARRKVYSVADRIAGFI